jgi:corrinoid protein of di/trimethylamine methyltransferase
MTSLKNNEAVFKQIADAVVDFDDEKGVELTKSALDQGIDAKDIILKGLTVGMQKVGDLYEKQEYFVPQLLLCSDVLYAALDIVKPHIEVDENKDDKIKVIMGTVEGDIHDIGKNLVKIMYEAAGWDVYDLGNDVPIDKFLEEHKKINANIVALSALMTTSMLSMPEIIKQLKEHDPKIVVMVGGAPMTAETASSYGADGYATNCGVVVKETLKAMNNA